MPTWIQNPDGSVQYVDEYGQPAAPPPVGLTPEEATALPAEPVVDPAAPVPTRQMAAAATPPAPSAPPTPAPSPALNPGLLQNGTSVGQSVAAFQPGRFQQVEGTTQGLRGAQAAAKARADAGAANESQFTVALGADQARAAQGLGNAEAEKEMARSQGFREQANLASMFAAAESAAAGIAAEKTSGYRARFEQSLAQASAMRVDPRLQFSQGDGLGAAALLFTQGFLQAQGTPVFNAQGMINQLIDRKVDRDLQAIQQGHRLAEGQKMLWDMARSEANDEAEARSRYRALMMTQAAAEMEATTAQFGSRVASAKGQAAAADIRVQVNKDLAEITDRYFKRYMAESGLALDEWKAKVAASHESQRIDLAKRELDAKLGVGAAPSADSLVFDVTESGENAAKWQFLPDTPDTKKVEIRDRMAAKAHFIDNVRKLRAMSAEAGKVYGGWGKAMTNNAFKKRVEALANGTVAAYVKSVSGLSYTDKEYERHASRIPINRLFQREGDKFVRQGLSDFQGEILRETNKLIGGHTVDIPKGDPRLGIRGGSSTWGEAEQVEADVLSAGREEEKNAIQQAAERLLAPEAANSPVEPTSLWKQVGNPITTEMRQAGKDLRPTTTIPGWAPAMEDLFYQAVNPNGDQEMRDAAREALLDVRGNTNDPAKQDYANDLLNLVDNPRTLGPSHLGGFLNDLELGALAE